MSERIPKSTFEKSQEKHDQFDNSYAEKLGKEIERKAEKHTDNLEATVEKTKHEALTIAQEHDEVQRAKNTAELNKQESVPRITKQDIALSYRKTMRSMQSQLSTPSRAFSKVIHNPVVEKTSDIVGNTVARPNLIIAGAIGAIASIVVYLLAKNYGYLLTGSETIVLFITGWVVGAVIEYARVGFGNRKK